MPRKRQELGDRRAPLKNSARLPSSARAPGSALVPAKFGVTSYRASAPRSRPCATRQTERRNRVRTGSSNPASSSGESGANSTPVRGTSSRAQSWIFVLMRCAPKTRIRQCDGESAPRHQQAQEQQSARHLQRALLHRPHSLFGRPATAKARQLTTLLCPRGARQRRALLGSNCGASAWAFPRQIYSTIICPYIHG
jgi:hypothetical protein